MHSIQWFVVSSQPKDSIDITFWFILGMVLSALIWFVCVCIMSYVRLCSIESFITIEFKYNRNIIKTLKESLESLTKIQRLEYIYNLKQIGKDHLPKYRDLLYSLCPCKINERLKRYNEWSNQYEMLEQLIVLFQENATPTEENKERMDVLCNLLLKESGNQPVKNLRFSLRWLFSMVSME